ncbi:glutamate synthase subunit beta [candidate division KSB1 bacterium]|nr:glutamate synthase subunit beta [candidate division KSB1 bacterium]
MDRLPGFMQIKRQDAPKRPVPERIKDYKELEIPLSPEQILEQSARCMDCGIPFCHALGCPVENRIPDWNHALNKGHWRTALTLLHSTNNFPEITGRICPAPCEAACTLSLDSVGVNIRQLELQIAERGWDEGWIHAEPAAFKTGKRIAVIGSGPAGLAAAQQLARLGHDVVIFEKANRIGGLLRYGIPDFKLEKWVLERRLDQLQQEGVRFECEVDAGIDISVRYLLRTSDAMIIATGACVQRFLQIPGRQLGGIHFAMEYLEQQNRKNAGETIAPEMEISARDKDVVVIGGGDTGADCVGTARRQGANEITQIELLPQPPRERMPLNPWPTVPQILRTSSAHEEGCFRLWRILTKEFIGDEGKVTHLTGCQLDWSDTPENGNMQFTEIPGSEFKLKADLVLLALGFIHTEQGRLVTDLGVQFDKRGNILVDQSNMTSLAGVFAAGDCVQGASLVARAIYQGRRAAQGIEQYFKKRS